VPKEIVATSYATLFSRASRSLMPTPASCGSVNAA
jgi:hypothetical protein